MRASGEFQLPATLLAAIVESAKDSIVSATLDGVITSWNAAAERMYGYTAAEIIGRNTSLLIPPETAAKLMPVLQRARRGEGIKHFETRLRRKDGSIIEVLLTDSPIRDASGAVVGTSAITRDLAERNRADARFLGLLEAAPDAMVCADQDGQIVLVNAQAERLFGYPREELAGQPVEILVPDASKAAHPALRAGYATDPRPRLMGAGLELSGRRRDGTAFPAEIALSALDTDQGLLVYAAVRDVTEQRQARDDLRRINQNLTSFSYSLAHDLRTPLRSLAGFSTALIEDYADTLGEDGRGYAQRIGAASEHMGHILDDLLGNAWKFTSGRDNASIEFGMTPAAEARVCCYVRDNGAGFNPEYTHKLFQPFQRLHTTREFPGTGIGLASVRQIVDRHNGRTWAEGTVGNDATFFFTLQAAEPAGPPDK